MIVYEYISLCKKQIKSIVLQIPLLQRLYDRWKGRYITKDIIGANNRIEIGKDSVFYGTNIRIRGDNNKLTIGRGCMIGPQCSFWISGNNIEIFVGDYCSFTLACHINASENGSKIFIGNDAMFSNNIIVRTSDDHPIFDIQTGERINLARNVMVEEHVWIAPNTKIMKGAWIHSGAIIGSDTTINKEVPSNSMAVGRPFKIVKKR